MKKAKKKEKEVQTALDIKATDSLPMNNLQEEDLSIKLTDGDVEVNLDDIEFQVILPLPVYNKLMTYTRLVDDEITGLGLVEKIGKWTFKITDVYLLDQIVSRAQCEIKPNSLVDLMDRLVKEGKNPSMLRLWWHSHNTMGANWSTTDVETGKKFAGTEYLVSIVTTHSGEMKARLNIFTPLELIIDNIPVLVSYPAQDNTSLIESCRQEVAEMVKKEVYPISSYGWGGHSSAGFCTVPKDKVCYTEPPFGECVVDKGVRFVWYRSELKYKAFDVVTEQPLTDKEAIEKAGTDYNYKYNWPNWYQYQESEYDNEDLSRYGIDSGY